MLFLYTILGWCITPFLYIKLHWRARKEPLYRFAISERFGYYPRNAVRLKSSVWVHAVSLGETRAITPYIEHLLVQGYSVLLTHMTATGRGQGADTFATAIASGQLQQVWLPYDTLGAVQRFFAYFQPTCGLLVETEVWPNLVRRAKKLGIPLTLVNARLSPRSFSRLCTFRRWSVPLYSQLSAILAQTRLDAERFTELLGTGVPVHITGNLKFDTAIATDLQAKGRAFLAAQQRPIVVVASTREGEEEWFIKAWQTYQTRMRDISDTIAPLWVLIPRHPQRFPEVASLLQAAHIPFVKRSSLSEENPQIAEPLLLGDSIGEMGWYYSMATIAIIGGGFLPFGGQNHIEAAQYQTPVIVGAHVDNFKQAVLDALSAGAAAQVSTFDEALTLVQLLLRPQNERLERMREATVTFIAQHQGALLRTHALLLPTLPVLPCEK